MSGQIKAEYVIFDMDGLLIDSERVYTDVTNEILSRYGKKMTWTMKAGQMGKTESEAAKFLLSFFPEIPLTPEEYLVERNALQDLQWPNVKLLPGALHLVKHLQGHRIPIAIATSSKRRNYLLKTGHLSELIDCFEGNIICGDDGNVKPGRGKPCPDIFLAAARDLLRRNVGTAEVDEASEEEISERSKGIVFEDAIPGFQAGKRAGMTVVWVPDPNLLNVDFTGPHRADEILRSLEEFVPEKWGLPPFAEKS